MRVAYTLLMEKLIRGSNSQEQHLTSSLPDEITDTRASLGDRRQRAIWRAMAAFEDIWATDRALLQLDSFEAEVLRPARGVHSPMAKHTAAAEFYMGIHKKVQAWGEDDDEQEAGPPPYSASAWANMSPPRRVGAILESTASPVLTPQASSAVVPVAPAASERAPSGSPGLSAIRERQQDGGSFGAPRLQGFTIHGSQEPHTIVPKDRLDNFASGHEALLGLHEERQRLNTELRQAVLFGTQSWFIDNVAAELCSQAMSRAEASYDRCLATLKVLKELQAWAVSVAVAEGSGAADSLQSLKNSLRDAVIHKGSELVGGAR